MSEEQEFRKAASGTKQDGYMFLPTYDKDGNEKSVTQIRGFDYETPGAIIGGSELGLEYEIMLFSNEMVITDYFSAILIDPITYIFRLTQMGFYGIVGKKTTTSRKHFEGVIAKVKELS